MHIFLSRRKYESICTQDVVGGILGIERAHRSLRRGRSLLACPHIPRVGQRYV